MNWRSKVRTSLVYLVSILAGFALAYLVVAFFVFPAGVVPRDVKVPNVTGLMFDEAQQRLIQAGFKSEQGEQRYNNSAPKNTVIEQSPPPGAREGIGNTITLVISGGQRIATVPTITGMTRADAEAQLQKDGFEVGEVTEASSSSPRGTVIATRPAAGSQVSAPSTINILLSAGSAAVLMPDLMGRELTAARVLLNQLGVRNVNVVYDPAAPGARGTIAAQSPVPNAPMAPGSTVQLRVAGDQGTP